MKKIPPHQKKKRRFIPNEQHPIQGVSKEIQPIKIIMIYNWDKCNDGHLEDAL